MSKNRRNLTAITLVVAAAAACAIIVQFSDASRFENWTREDGPVENLQALLYGIGSAFFFFFAFRNRRNPLAWLFAIGMFFCAGEEISWGQRILGFSTPGEIDSVNIQHEANLHNIENIHGNVRTYGFMLLGAMFVILPILELRFLGVQSIQKKIRFVSVPLQVVPIAAAAFGFMLVPRYIDSDAFGFDEVGELFTAVTLCAYAVAIRRPTAWRQHKPQMSSTEAVDFDANPQKATIEF